MRQRDPARETSTDALERAHEARLLQAGQMLAGIVHEIKNPLAVIQGYAQLLEERCADESNRQDLRSILQETLRLGALIEDMLSFLRRGPDTAGDVDLRRVVEAALNLSTHAMRQSRVTVVAALPERLPLVRGHHGAYMQVLLNLLRNARESLEEHGGPDRSIAVRYQQGDAGRAQLCVIDNGPAIPADHVDTIFDPFFTTKDAAAGMGLGLALCRDILARFGARITLDSPTGTTGVCFRLDLPQVELES